MTLQEPLYVGQLAGYTRPTITGSLCLLHGPIHACKWHFYKQTKAQELL